MVESGVRSGYTITALDAFGDRDLKALTEARSLHHDFHSIYSPKALFRASRQLQFERVAYTSNLENHPEILQLFCESHRILGNDAQTVAAVRDWKKLFAGLRAAGFPAPETIYAGETRTLDPDRRWLIKPILSGGGHGITFLQGERTADDSYIIQEFIPGRACSASFIANGKECVLLGITEQLIGLRDFGTQGFRYCGNILPLPETLMPRAGSRILEQIRQLSAFLTREYGLIGVNGIDFILNGDRIWVTEVNPRYSASMELIERAYELPIFHLHLQAVLHCSLPVFRLERQLKDGRFWGKSILYASKDAVMPDTLDWAARHLRDIPESGEIIRKGSPVCTILATQPTYDEALNKLIRQANALKKEIYD